VNSRYNFTKNCRFCEPRVTSCTLCISYNEVRFCSLPLIPRECILRHRNFSHRPREGYPCHVPPSTDPIARLLVIFLSAFERQGFFRRVQPSHHSLFENGENFILRSTCAAQLALLVFQAHQVTGSLL